MFLKRKPNFWLHKNLQCLKKKLFHGESVVIKCTDFYYFIFTILTFTLVNFLITNPQIKLLTQFNFGFGFQKPRYKYSMSVCLIRLQMVACGFHVTDTKFTRSPPLLVIKASSHKTLCDRRATAIECSLQLIKSLPHFTTLPVESNKKISGYMHLAFSCR